MRNDDHNRQLRTDVDAVDDFFIRLKKNLKSFHTETVTSCYNGCL